MMQEVGVRAITVVMEKAPDGKEHPVTKYGPPEALAKAMQAHARLVVYGEPGGGKTTLTQQRALGMLTSELLPVRVLAKHWALKSGDDWLSLHDYLTLHYPETVGFHGEEAKTLGALLWSKYEAGRVALFVDALDETERRGELCEHLRRLPVRGKLVLTCRSAFMGERNLPEIPRYLTAGLTRTAALTYIDQRPGTTRKAEFRALLEGDSPTAKLIETPLCLAMVLRLFDAGKYAPPANRDVLYAEYTEYALDTKQRQKPAPILEEHQIDPRQSRFFNVRYKIAILEHFAYARRFDNQPADTTTLAGSIATVAEQRVWKRRAYNDLLFQADVLTDILQHSGILFTPSDGGLGAGAPLTWLHQTIEEYLAAGELARRWEQDGHPLSHDEPPVILFDPQARETVLLAVGRLKPDTAQSFLEAIAACPPLCDFGLQAISRRRDVSKAILETCLDSLLNLVNLMNPAYPRDVPTHGLTALTVAVESNIIFWAIESLLSRFKSVSGEDARLVKETIATALETLFISESIESLLSRFKSVSGEDAYLVRRAIATALRTLFISESVESLLSRFKSVSGEDAYLVQQAIATALGIIGDNRAVESLLSHFDSVSGKGAHLVQRAIATALGIIGDSRVVEFLLSRFESVSGEYTGFVQETIATALETLFISESVESLLSRFEIVVREENWLVQRAIATALGKISDSHAVEFLISRFESVSGEDAYLVQRAIATALGIIGDSRAVESLISRFESVSGEDAYLVRRAIATALGKIGDSRAVESLISRFESVSGDDNWSLKQDIVIALVRIGDSCAVKFLLSYFDSMSEEDDWRIRVVIASELGSLLGNESVESLLSRLDSVLEKNVYLVPQAIATALLNIGKQAVPEIWKVWKNLERSENTRNHMEHVLFKLGTFSPEREKKSFEPDVILSS